MRRWLATATLMSLLVGLNSGCLNLSLFNRKAHRHRSESIRWNTASPLWSRTAARGPNKSPPRRQFRAGIGAYAREPLTAHGPGCISQLAGWQPQRPDLPRPLRPAPRHPIE